MATGTVKQLNADKGHGFIQSQSGGKDVFVHITAGQAAEMRGLEENQKGSYDVVNKRGKQSEDDPEVFRHQPKCALHKPGTDNLGRDAQSGAKLSTSILPSTAARIAPARRCKMVRCRSRTTRR